MTSEMSTFDVLEEPSFTLPARPGLLAPEPVDLLADPEPRRLPEGTVSGFAVIGALVAFSCLVGGFTAGLVVIGVSTLLAAIAAIVRGDVSLSPVGGQRGAAVLLGAAVTALIVGSVTTHEHRSAPEVADGVPVPVSSPFAVSTQTAYAAVPPAGDSAGSAGSAGSGGSAATSGAASHPASVGSTRSIVPPVALPAATPAAVPTPSVQVSPPAPSTAPGLTLSLDALSPKAPKAAAREQADDQGSGPNAGKGSGNGAGQGSGADVSKASDKAGKAAQKAAEKAAKAAEKAAKAAAKAAEKAAKAAEKAAKAAAAEAEPARTVVQGLGSATSSRRLLGVVRQVGAKGEKATAGADKRVAAKAGQWAAKKDTKTEKQTAQRSAKQAEKKATKQAGKTSDSSATSGR